MTTVPATTCSGQFTKGNPGGSRRKGDHNRFTRELKNAIAIATKLAGDRLLDKTGRTGVVSYLLHLAEMENPAIFGANVAPATALACDVGRDA
jgi:hypothetical protein